MNDRCSTEPLQLPDGRVIQPDEPLTLETLCEIFPIFFEMEAAKLQAQSKGSSAVRPGQPLGLAPSNAPAGFQTPGQISPFGAPGGGPSSGAGSGGGGGPIPAGGGGGRSRVTQGTQGPRGPRGPGSILAPIVKTDGDFVIASADPYTPVPGTFGEFDASEAGVGIFLVQVALGTLGDTPRLSNGQIGLRINGQDYNLTPYLAHSFVANVATFLEGCVSILPLSLIQGHYTVEVVVRGDGAFSTNPQGLPTTVQANPTVPLRWTVIYP